jgi:CPA2 family monovalent cation:H+ antiporter-2
LNNLDFGLIEFIASLHNFEKNNEDSLKILTQYKNNQSEYISRVRKQIEIQKTLLSGELSRKFSLNDHAWDSDQMKRKSKSVHIKKTGFILIQFGKLNSV